MSKKISRGNTSNSITASAVGRRRFMKTIGLTMGTAALPWGAVSLGVESPGPKRNKDKALGAFLGAAIGDAMGGPVENLSADRMKQEYGEITGFLPYSKDHIHPGAALHPEPGSITDDTYIRVDLTRFYLNTEPPRTPRMLVDWLLKNANFSNWWGPAVDALKRIRDGKVTAEEGGLTHAPGGGGAWWTPVGILYAGNPAGAAAEIRSLCRPWKGPLEQDILAAVHAGTAEAQREGATADSVVNVILSTCGPEARTLMERAAAIAREAKSSDEFHRELYAHCLVQSILFAEQQPLALAAFVYGRGEPERAIPHCVMIGRDCDSTASNLGGWCGGLHGESGLPKKWVETVCEVNRRDCDLRDLGERSLTVKV
jgi:ADP-ribosylglycohydrolase